MSIGQGLQCTPHVYYIKQCYTHQTSCMVSRLYKTSYDEC